MIRIVESKFMTSAVKSSSYPLTVLPEFAFVGRSNVGKSSMINSLTNRKLLAKIANKPGKTRLINFFECRYLEGNSPSPLGNREQGTGDGTNSQFSILNSQFTLVDLPGYGYAKVSKAERDLWQRMITEYFQNRKQLTGVVVLVDIRHEPDPKDIIMVQMLRNFGVNFMIAATKCDKIPSGRITSSLKLIKMGFDLNDELLCGYSSVKKTGQEKILNWIETNISNSVSINKYIKHE